MDFVLGLLAAALLIMDAEGFFMRPCRARGAVIA